MIENGSLSSFNETKSFGFLDQAKHPERAMWLLIFIASAFCVINVISNVIAGKLILISGRLGIYCAGASLIFPLVNIIQDILSNIYGTKAVKYVTLLGVITNVFMAITFMICLALPVPDFFTNTESYRVVLNQSFRLVVGGLVALFVAQMVNSIVLQKMKKYQVNKGISTANRGSIFTRSYISSLPSTLLDAAIFNFIAFIGGMPTSAILVMIATQFCVKVGIELFLQFFINSWVVKKLVDWTGLDVVDA